MEENDIKNIIANTLREQFNNDLVIQDFLNTLKENNLEEINLFDKIYIFSKSYSKNWKISQNRLKNSIQNLHIKVNNIKMDLYRNNVFGSSELRFIYEFNFDFYVKFFDKLNANQIIQELEAINELPIFNFVIKSMSELIKKNSIKNSDKHHYINDLILYEIYNISKGE